MEITPKAQAVDLIKQSQTVLILTHQDPDGDAIGSALALHLALKKMKKEVDTLITGKLSEVFSFLPGLSEIKNEVATSNDLVLTIDTRSTGEDIKLGYKKFSDEHRIKIVITPPRGTLTPDDVTIERTRPKYDLVVFLDCSTMERIGALKTELADLFYEVPTIQIDHHADNTHFAKVNWVDLTATSTAEILVSFIESLSRDEPLLDADIATNLLTGLTTDTGSFQHSNTTPKSLTVAAQLVAVGARQQEIIERIYRTIGLSKMRLMGLMLSKVKKDPAGFIWTTITEEDLKLSGGDAGDISGLASELAKSVGPDVDFALLLSDREGEIRGNLRSINKTCNVAEIARRFDGGGHNAAAGFRIEGTLRDHLQSTLEKIRGSRGVKGVSTEAEQTLVAPSKVE